MKKLILPVFLLVLVSCSTAPQEFVHPAAERTLPPEPVTTQPWSEVVVSVTDLERTARFFLEVGGYEIRSRGVVDPVQLQYWGLRAEASAEELVLAFPSASYGFVRLVRFDNAGLKRPMRPGGHAWDKGCFASIMVRAKNLERLYDEATALGWLTETPITNLSFGTSRLKSVVFKGPGGLQVQSYERLTPPLPETIPQFDRMTQPFNIMSLVADRAANRKLFVDVLGFSTFFYGKPYKSDQPEYTPLGIPKSLTDKTLYRTAILAPAPGEFGRVEMIETMDIQGYDFSENCVAPNLGILAIRFPVENAAAALGTIQKRGWPVSRPLTSISSQPHGQLSMFGVTTPDGSMIDFYSMT